MKPVTITASEIRVDEVIPTHTKKMLLLDRLEHIEHRILQLHRRIFSEGERCSSQVIQRLIDLIRNDKHVLTSLCIAGCDHYDPEMSLDHDHTNNDFTLSLYAELAIALRVGCRDRILRLHKLQRDICHRLKELGMDRSVNARL